MEAQVEDRILSVLKAALQKYDEADAVPIENLEVVDGELLFTAELGGAYLDFAVKVEEL